MRTGMKSAPVPMVRSCDRGVCTSPRAEVMRLNKSAPQRSFPVARFTGARWVIVMDDEQWRFFSHDVPAAANERLTVLLEHLAEHGEGRLPRPGLRWLGQAVAENRGASIEARGCVLSGRVSVVEGRTHFFISQITLDDPEPAPSRPTRRKRNFDDRQGAFTFDHSKSGH